MFYFRVYSSVNKFALLHFEWFQVFEYCRRDSNTTFVIEYSNTALVLGPPSITLLSCTNMPSSSLNGCNSGSCHSFNSRVSVLYIALRTGVFHFFYVFFGNLVFEMTYYVLSVTLKLLLSTSFVHSCLSIPMIHLLEFDCSVFGSHWQLD